MNYLHLILNSIKINVLFNSDWIEHFNLNQLYSGVHLNKKSKTFSFHVYQEFFPPNSTTKPENQLFAQLIYWILLKMQIF